MKHVSLLLVIGSIGFAWLNVIMLEWPKSETKMQTLYGLNAPETEAALKQFFEIVLSEGRIGLVDEMVAQDFIARSYHSEEYCFEGREALKDAIVRAHHLYPGYEIKPTDYAVYDNRVVFYWPGGVIMEGGLPVMDPHAEPGLYGMVIFCFKKGVLQQTYFNHISDYQSSGNDLWMNEDKAVHEGVSWI